jgi:hypothetical protein
MRDDEQLRQDAALLRSFFAAMPSGMLHVAFTEVERHRIAAAFARFRDAGIFRSAIYTALRATNSVADAIALLLKQRMTYRVAPQHGQWRRVARYPADRRRAAAQRARKLLKRLMQRRP